MKRIPLKTGDEFDAFTRWRKVTSNNHNKRAKTKRRYRRRERQIGKIETVQGLFDWHQYCMNWE